jgi:hypothetical protein
VFETLAERIVGRPPAAQGPGEFSEQPGLADPGLTADEHDRAATRG